jgi:hypothetical protein
LGNGAVKLVEIYGLYCPDSDELRYVGKANNAGNEAQQRNPEAWKKLQKAKRDLGRLLANFMKDGDYSMAAALRFRMRLDAANRPDLYGSWANL